MEYPYKKTLLSTAIVLALAAAPAAQAAEGDPVGDVFQVNTTTSGSQFALWGEGGIAMDADGDINATWTDYYDNDGPGYSGNGAYLRRFSADGTALDASDSVVNTHTNGHQYSLGISTAPDGRFVVVVVDKGWSPYTVGVRLYDADGVAQGDPIQVNTDTIDGVTADVAMAADGSFVVVWVNSSLEVVARRFSADGTELDEAEVPVSTTATTVTEAPHIAIDPAGNYTIVWLMKEEAGDLNVRARRYDADGIAIDAADYIVNTTTSGDQTWPDVAVDADGDYVVTWVEYTSNTGVYAKRFNAAGDVLQDEFAVMLDADYTGSFLSRPAVAMDAEGDFAIAVHDYGSSDGDGYATYMQRYDSSGTALYSSPVNVGGPAGNDGAGGIAMDADGDTVVLFTNVYGGDDGSASGVFAQRYEGKGHTVDLMLAGSDDVSADIAPGDALTYTFAVTNNGSGVALGLSLEDVLPTGISYTGYSDTLGDGWSCSDSSGTVTCTLPSLASGGSSSVDITVDTASVTSHSIENSASVSNGVTDANDTNNSDTVVTGYNNLPAFDATPSISGSAAVGETLTVTDTATSDADGDTVTLSYQWLADGVAISGATAASYTLTGAEAHTDISVTVTADDGYGTMAATSTSVSVGNSAPAFSATPSISGSAAVGETLTVIDTATFDADGDTLTLSYQWQADGVAISGASSSSYTVQPGDEDAAITAGVTVSDGYGGTASATTEAVSIAVDSGLGSSSSGGGGALGWWSLFMGLLLFRRRPDGRNGGQ